MADACCGATAGRMQDNEPLMRALSSLIVTNTPDLVLFVGEALVGNDAVDQLAKVTPPLCACAETGRSWFVMCWSYTSRPGNSGRGSVLRPGMQGA